MAIGNTNIPNHVLITGAAGSLGRQLAIGLSEKGCKLSLCDCNEQALNNLVSETKITDAIIFYDTIDVTNKEAISNFIALADHKLAIDWLVTAAGISEPLFTSNFEQAKNVFETNYLGTVQSIFPAVQQMKKRQKGRIILISSMSSLFGFPRVPQYAASKAAVRVLGQSLRYWLRCENIHITIVCPGFFDSGMSHRQNLRPNVMTAEYVSNRIISGAMNNKTVLTFPKILEIKLRIVALLPYRIQDIIFEKYI